METLTVEGKNYVKAKSAARELGYTPDYIGQLCRAGKIDARLIGRSWYVDIRELSSHKDSKYGTKGTKSIKVKTSPAEEKGEKVTVHKISELSSKGTPAEKKYANHVYWNAPRYEPDEESLLPEVQKREINSNGVRITVTPTDAQPLEVESEPGESYKMSATKLPEVRLNGVLKVSSMEEENSYEDELAAQAKKLDEDDAAGKHQAKPLANPRGVVGMKRVPIRTDGMHRAQAPRAVAPATANSSAPADANVSDADASERVQTSSEPRKPAAAPTATTAPKQRPMSRFEQRIQAKLAEDESDTASQSAPAPKPKPASEPSLDAAQVAESSKTPVAKVRQSTPQGEVVEVKVSLAPYVLTAVLLAAVTLSVVFGLNSVVISNDVATKHTIDFNLANIYQPWF